MPLAGFLYPRVGARPLAFAGLLITALSAALLATTDVESELWLIRTILFARGIGFGLALLPLMRPAQASGPAAR